MLQVRGRRRPGPVGRGFRGTLSVRFSALLVSACVLAPWSASAQVSSGPSTAATGPGPADRLAAASLAHSARSLGHLREGSIAARAGRIRALLEAAWRISPDDAETNRQMLDLYEGLGDAERAAQAADRYLRVRPDDYAVFLRWLRLAQAGLDRADDRIAFLETVAADRRLSRGARAAAFGEIAGIRLRQGEDALARQACAGALDLDALEAGALAVRAQLATQPARRDVPRAPADTFALALAMFRDSPRNVQLAWKAGQLLQSAGVYDGSLAFYEHAVALARERPPPGDVVETLMVDYLNALLDAGKPAAAIERFDSVAKDYGHSLALRTLVVEAHRALGQKEEAESHVKAMSAIYGLLAPEAGRTPAQAAEVAWFNLTCRGQAPAALEWAKTAAVSAGSDPFVQRVLGAAELAAGNAAEGIKRLTPLVPKDAYAAAILAGHYFAQDQPDEGRKVVLAAAGNIRTGPGWRALARLAGERGIALPPSADAERLQAAAADLPAYVMDMGRSPERFLSVELTAPERVLLAEPVPVTVTLRNLSEHPLPVGPEGLLTPVVFLSLLVEGDAKGEMSNLTAANLPAPKYLAPHAAVSHTVRVDVGPAERFLAEHPLGELRLSIGALVDPLQRGKDLVSSVPTVKVAPVAVARAALYAPAADATAARYALGYVVRDLKEGSPAEQMRAARQTASLLGYVQRVEKGRARPACPEVLTKPVLLSMTRAFLQARAPGVRAEMLAALEPVDLEERIIALMAPNVEDVSPLVRLRLIELLAGKRTRGHETLLDVFAKDPDESVRRMASSLATKE